MLVGALAGKADVRIQSAFAASDGSMPEPDAAVVPSGDYDEAHPTEAWLIVEVYTDPQGGEYSTITRRTRGESIPLVQARDVTVAVSLAVPGLLAGREGVVRMNALWPASR